MSGCVLIYVYSARSQRKTPPPQLRPDQLLIPPIMTNKLPWRKGYFEFLEHAALDDRDRLERHCFWDSILKRYMDEHNHVVATPLEPVSEWGLHSFRTIDDAVSKALGISLAPD